MLVEASLAQLSPAQLKKLQKGQPVRVKHGSAHKVGVLPAQHRKLMKAHMKGKGMVLALPSMGGMVEPAPSSQGNLKATSKDAAKQLIVAGTERAVRALEGSGKGKPRLVSKKLKGGANLTATSKDAAKQLIVAGADRAIRAIEGSGGGAAPQRLKGGSSRDFNMKEAMNQIAEGRPFKKKDGSAPMSMQSISAGKPLGGKGVKGGKVSRLKKFNEWSKAVGQKFLPINKNLKPIKDAASARAAQYITEYNNPEALAKSALDTFQEEAPQTFAAFRDQPTVYAEPVPYEPDYPTAYPSFPAVPTQSMMDFVETRSGQRGGYPYFPQVPKQEELSYEPVVWYGSGTKKGSKPAKGSPEMKAKMAALRALKGGAKKATPKPTPKVSDQRSAPKPTKGSPEMKAKMAALRAMKKSGGALYPAGY